MKVTIFFACSGVIIDTETNTASIFNIIEEVSNKLPVVFPELFLFALINRESGDPDSFKLTIICNNAGTDVFNNNVDVSFKGKQRSRLKISLRGFPVTAVGDLKFSILNIDRKVLAEYTIVVIPTQPTPEASNV